MIVSVNVRFEITEQHRPELDRLCHAFSVARLEIFGSGAADEVGGFDTARSDLDFIVEFKALPETEIADHYFGVLEGLEKLFDRHVDLVMAGAMQNPYFIKSVNQTRRAVYAA
jgi:uncharacterized protein